MDTLKLATLLLHIFGYVNAKEENINILDGNLTNGVQDYILIEFCEIKYQFTFDDDGETKSWKLIILE